MQALSYNCGAGFGRLSPKANGMLINQHTPISIGKCCLLHGILGSQRKAIVLAHPYHAMQCKIRSDAKWHQIVPKTRNDLMPLGIVKFTKVCSFLPATIIQFFTKASYIKIKEF